MANGNYNEVKAEYERLYSEENTGVYGDLEILRAEQRGNIWDMQYDEDGKNDAPNSRPIGSQTIQNNAAGNTEYLRSGNKGIQLNAENKASSNEGAFSMPENLRYSVPTQTVEKGLNKTAAENGTGEGRFALDNNNKSSVKLSKANKEGELVNDFYYALNRGEWKSYYNAITGNRYLEKTEPGDIIVVAVGNKLLISERQMRGKDAHDFQVVDAYQSQPNDFESEYLLKEINSMIEESGGYNGWQTGANAILRTYKTYDEKPVIKRFNRNSGTFDNGIASFGEKRVSRQDAELYKDQSNRSGVPNKNEQRVESIEAELDDSAFSMPENLRYSVPTQTADNTDVESNDVDKYTYDYSKSFSEQVDDYDNGIFPQYNMLVVGKTPQVFIKIGLNPLPITYTTGHLKDLLNKVDDDHNLEKEQIYNIPKSLENPIAIIKSKSKNAKSNSIVAIVDIVHNGKHAICAIAFDGKGYVNNKRIDSNVITTIHTRDNTITKLLKEAVEDESKGYNSIYYWQKNKAIQLLKASKVQFLGGNKITDGFVNSIRNNNSKVKIRLNNVIESQQFKRWFGKSKAVNKDGTPRVLYHRTNSEFTVFDTTKSGTNQGKTHGDGIYLSSNKNEFDYAGDIVMELYAAVQNPFEMELSESQANKIYDKYFAPFHEDKFNTYRPHVINALMSSTKVFDYLTEAAETNNTTTSKILSELGYDGVHDGSEWFGFECFGIRACKRNGSIYTRYGYKRITRGFGLSQRHYGRINIDPKARGCFRIRQYQRISKKNKSFA